MRKKLILESAYEEFSKKGYNASLSEIAKASGIKKQTLYNYFDNKDDLFYEMIVIQVQQYFNMIEKELEAIEDLKAHLKMKRIYYSIIEYYKDLNKLRFWRWILLIESKKLFIKTQEVINKHEKKISIELKKLIKDLLVCEDSYEESILPIIQTYMVMIHGTLDGMLLYSGNSKMASFIDNVWNTYWNGIEKTFNIHK